MSSSTADLSILYIAISWGGLISIFMSALSVNAESMASVTFDVVKNMTLGYLSTNYNIF